MRSIVLLLGFFLSVVLSAVPPSELKALQDLFKTTNGEDWSKKSNWNKGDPCENNWYGIECDSNDEHVRNLQLAGNNLGGYLPENLGDLRKLYMVGLDIHPNHIGGEIPESLGNCTEMVLLTLEQQEVTGKIPESFDKLENLMVLHLGNNQLTHIPPLGNMGKGSMQSFVVANNNIQQLLPNQGPSAYQCDLSGNMFKCPIPNWAENCKAVCT